MTDFSVVIVILLNFIGIVGSHLVARVKIEHRLTELETKIDYVSDAINTLPCKCPQTKSRVGNTHRHGFSKLSKAC